MRVITVRIPDEDGEALETIERVERADRAAVVRKLLAEGIRRWRIRHALDLLRERKVTIRSAARKAGVSYGEMLDLAAAEGVTSGYSWEELRRDTREG